MKTLILVTLLTLSSPAIADKPYFIGGDPGISIRAGGNPGAGKEYHATVIEYESRFCVDYINCFTPFVAVIENKAGIGIDYSYTAFKSPNRGGLVLKAGMVNFEAPVNGDDKSNAHVGIAVELFMNDKHGLIFAVDNYQADKPITVISMGWKFR